MKKLLVLFLALIITLSTVFTVGCAKEPTAKTDPNYIVKVKQTNDSFLTQGKSDYVIVVPSDADGKENMAASELQLLFKEATSCTLPIITDAEVSSFNEKTDKYIFIGETSVTKDYELVPESSKYNRSGYIIKSVGKSLFIAGAYSAGTLFGTYKYLELLLDYDYFGMDIYQINTGIANLNLFTFDVSVIYDINSARMNYGFSNNATYNLKHSLYRGITTPVGGGTGHSSIGWFPKDTYLNPAIPSTYHPEFVQPAWESAWNGRYNLCYTARGNSFGTYDLMTSIVADKIKESMKQSEENFVFDFSMSDSHEWCTCEYCTAISEKYNADSALVIRFLNDVCEKVDAWFETEEGKPYYREYQIDFYAYYDLINVPNLTIDDSVYLSKHVIPVIADVKVDLGQDPSVLDNMATTSYFVDWGKAAKNVSAYMYACRYDEYICPYEFINDMQSWFRFFEKQNVNSVYLLGSAEINFATGWGNLAVYLSSKLACNVDVNVNEYIRKYFNGVYKDAADTMLAMFNSWRVRDEYNSNIKDPVAPYQGSASCYNKICFPQFFPKGVLDYWMSLFEKALSEIEHLKESDPESYAVIKKMIVGERVGYDYLYFQTYKNDLPSEEISTVAKRLIDDAEFVGVTRYREGGEPREMSVYLDTEVRGYVK